VRVPVAVNATDLGRSPIEPTRVAMTSSATDSLLTAEPNETPLGEEQRHKQRGRRAEAGGKRLPMSPDVSSVTLPFPGPDVSFSVTRSQWRARRRDRDQGDRHRARGDGAQHLSEYGRGVGQP